MAERQVLRRELGVFGAVMMGLGSIVGTGVFVSIGVAAGITGPSVVLAVAVGALIALLNGLSSAQLAASHAVSGGTYEYGYRYLNPLFGFIAGWTFLIAKSASAATAALGFAGYLLRLLGAERGGWLVPLALSAVLGMTLVVLAGIRRSSLTNVVIVSVTLGALGLFIVTGLPSALANAGANFADFFAGRDARGGLRNFLYASALMFVAYTGYGRIATLGEEVKAPLRTIPRAIVVTLVVTMALYGLVAFVAVGAAGSATLGDPENRAAPLEVAARTFGLAAVPQIIALGAITAMLGVLLNLILGLSRVLLAMGRRRDMPGALGTLDATGTTPTAAVVVVGAIIAALASTGDVRTTWSFSAFTVLIYYAITNLAALYLPAEGRLFPRWTAALGLVACLGLAFFVEAKVWLAGSGLIGLGVIWHLVARRLRGD